MVREDLTLSCVFADRPVYRIDRSRGAGDPVDLSEVRELQCNDLSGFAPDARSGAVLFAPVGHEGVKFGSDMPFLTTMRQLVHPLVRRNQRHRHIRRFIDVQSAVAKRQPAESLNVRRQVPNDDYVGSGCLSECSKSRRCSVRQ